MLSSTRARCPRYAKTGATTTERYRVSWLVGLLQTSKGQYVFASAVWRQNEEVDTLEGARLAVRTFMDAGLLHSRSAQR